MPREIFNEGRVVGYSAYEVYLREYWLNNPPDPDNPDQKPATERQWLASSLAMGSSMILRLPNVSAANEDTVTYLDVDLPANSTLVAANTIIASFFDGDVAVDSKGWATRVKSYGSGLANNSSVSPSGKIDPIVGKPSGTPAPDSSYAVGDPTYREKLKDYMKIIDGVVIQAGTWKTSTKTPPQKDFTPNLYKPPRIRLAIKGSVSNHPLVLFTGFTIGSVIAGLSDTEGSTDTLYPQDGDFLGPSVYPWANKIVFYIPSSFEQFCRYNAYSRKLPTSASEKTPKGQPIIDMETTDPGTYYNTKYSDSPVNINVTKLNVLPDEADVLTVYRRSDVLAPALYGVKATSTGATKISPIDTVAPGTIKIYPYTTSAEQNDEEVSAKTDAENVQRKIPNNLGFVQNQNSDDFRIFQADTTSPDTAWVPISDDYTKDISSELMYQVCPVGYLGAKNESDIYPYIGEQIYERTLFNILSYIILHQKIFYIVPKAIKDAFGVTVNSLVIKKLTEASLRSGGYYKHVMDSKSGYWPIQMLDDLRRKENPEYHNLNPYQSGISDEEKTRRTNILKNIDKAIDKKYYFLCIGTNTVDLAVSSLHVLPVERETNILDVTVPLHLNMSELPNSNAYTISDNDLNNKPDHDYRGETIHVRGFKFDDKLITLPNGDRVPRKYFAGVRAEGEATKIYQWMFDDWSKRYNCTISERHPYLYEVWNSTLVRHDHAMAPRLGTTISDIMNVYKQMKLSDVWTDTELSTTGVFEQYRNLTLWDFIKEATCHNVTNGSGISRKSSMTSSYLAIMGTRYMYTNSHLYSLALASTIDTSTGEIETSEPIHPVMTGSKPDIEIDFDIDAANVFGVHYVDMNTAVYNPVETGSNKKGIYICNGQSGKRFTKSVSLIDDDNNDLQLVGTDGTIDISGRTLNWITLLTALGGNMSIDVLGDFLRKLQQALIDASTGTGQFLINITHEGDNISITLDTFKETVANDSAVGTYVVNTTIGSKKYKSLALSENTSDTPIYNTSDKVITDGPSSTAETGDTILSATPYYVRWKDLFKALKSNKVVDLLGYAMRMLKNKLSYSSGTFTINGKIKAKTATGNTIQSGTNYMIFTDSNGTETRLYISNTKPSESGVPVGSIGIGWGFDE